MSCMRLVPAVLLALASLSSAASSPASLEEVRIATPLGSIVIAVDTARAPVTSRNFLRYVDEKLFDGSSFYRTVNAQNSSASAVKIEILQGGLDDDPRAHPPIELETTQATGITHKAGTVSMARSKEENSATSEFFICLEDEPELDFKGEGTRGGGGYAAFGQVVSGMDVVRKIHQSRAEGQKLTPAIRIDSVRRVASGPASGPTPEKITVPGAFNVTRVDATLTCAGATGPQSFARIKQLGYTAIINLRRDGEQGIDIAAARKAAEAAGLKYVHVPVETENVTREAVDAFIKAVTDTSNHPMYVHCGSANRVAALWLIKRVKVDGWDVAKATAEAEAIGLTNPGMRKFALGYVASPGG